MSELAIRKALTATARALSGVDEELQRHGVGQGRVSNAKQLASIREQLTLMETQLSSSQLPPKEQRVRGPAEPSLTPGPSTVRWVPWSWKPNSSTSRPDFRSRASGPSEGAPQGPDQLRPDREERPAADAVRGARCHSHVRGPGGTDWRGRRRLLCGRRSVGAGDGRLRHRVRGDAQAQRQVRGAVAGRWVHAGDGGGRPGAVSAPPAPGPSRTATSPPPHPQSESNVPFRSPTATGRKRVLPTFGSHPPSTRPEHRRTVEAS